MPVQPFDPPALAPPLAVKDARAVRPGRQDDDEGDGQRHEKYLLHQSKPPRSDAGNGN